VHKGPALATLAVNIHPVKGTVSPAPFPTCSKPLPLSFLTTRALAFLGKLSLSASMCGPYTVYGTEKRNTDPN